ncbi:MAG: hypothetical protein JRM73_01130 [Nitrososphaerota archaeon]|nr:hypothetical protein [Nitrososphaerota archaeon]
MIGPKTAVSLAAVGALGFIDANYVYLFLHSNILNQATWFELLIFGVQFVKTGVALAFKDFRDGDPALLVDLYGAEFLIIPVAFALIFVVGAAPVGALLNELIRGWMVGVAFAGLPYAAYRIGRSMLRSGTLSTVLPSAIMAAEFGVLFVNATSSAVASQSGLIGVADFALLGKGTIASGDPWVFGALSVLYASLLIYAVMAFESRVTLSATRALEMGAAGTGATLVLAYAFSPLALPIVFVLLPPTMFIAAASWWFTRAR